MKSKTGQLVGFEVLVILVGTLTHIKAYECGLITEIIDEENFEAEAMAQVKELSNLSIRSMEVSKALVQVRDPRTGILLGSLFEL